MDKFSATFQKQRFAFLRSPSLFFSNPTAMAKYIYLGENQLLQTSNSFITIAFGSTCLRAMLEFWNQNEQRVHA
jgi:hypothetical protein